MKGCAVTTLTATGSKTVQFMKANIEPSKHRLVQALPFRENPAFPYWSAGDIFFSRLVAFVL
jgi:hypothetical protein